MACAASAPDPTNPRQVLVRRFLLADLKSEQLTVLAVLLTGFEEVLFRSTVVWRDQWLNGAMGSPQLEGDALQRQRAAWATSINQSMALEMCSIVVATFTTLFFHRHRFAFNFGYSADGKLDVSTALFSMLLQVVAEVVVDVASLRTEAEQGLPVFEYVHTMRNPVLLGLHATSLPASFSLLLLTYSSEPTVFHCAKSHPCACTSGFDLYRGLCAEFERGGTVARNSTLTKGLESEELGSFGYSVVVGLLVFICCVVLVVLAISKAGERRKAEQVEAMSSQVDEMAKSAKARRASRAKLDVKMKQLRAELVQFDAEKEANREKEQRVVETAKAKCTGVDLGSYEVPFEALELRKKIGEGGFAEVRVQCSSPSPPLYLAHVLHPKGVRGPLPLRRVRREADPAPQGEARERRRKCVRSSRRPGLRPRR